VQSPEEAADEPAGPDEMEIPQIYEDNRAEEDLPVPVGSLVAAAPPVPLERTQHT